MFTYDNIYVILILNVVWVVFIKIDFECIITKMIINSNTNQNEEK